MKRTFQRLLGQKPSRQESSLLNLIYTPPSRRCAFCRNGKAATSSVLRVLFQIEFGTPLTASLRPIDDINPDAVVHRLRDAGIFDCLGNLKDGYTPIQNALRLTTVRHPQSRAVSSFLYLCKSHDLAHPPFSKDRMQMNAFAGFDWNTDPRTPAGFEKFLRYIASVIQARGDGAPDVHWRPQTANIRPALFAPDIIGKSEDLSSFYAQLSENLNQDITKDLTTSKANTNPDTTNRSELVSTTSRQLIREIYASDFDTFDYAETPTSAARL